MAKKPTTAAKKPTTVAKNPTTVAKKPTTVAKEPATVAKRPDADSASKSESESSESESDSSESDSEGESEAKVAVNGITSGTTTSTTSTTSSDSTSDSDSAPENADESIHMADRDRQVALPNFIAPDFVLRKGDDANGDDVARLCSQANMQGKQLWYFTVPANVPISVVQDMEIPMDQPRGEGVFSHAGEDYGVSFESMAPKSSIQILIPAADSTQYQRGASNEDRLILMDPC